MIKYFRSDKRYWVIGSGLLTALAVALSFVIPSLVQADTVDGTVEITAGSLSMSAIDNPVFPGVTLNSTDQTSTDTIAIDVVDTTGSGDGWNLQIAATQFTSGASDTLASGALSITTASASCDGTGTCTDPTDTDNTVTYPVALTAGNPAVKFFSADLDTGLGDFTVTPSFTLDIPATTYAGTYTSTLTITIVSGP